MFNFHFISGFPRSGTTLLAAILRQNPDFYSHIESPTGRLFVETISALGFGSEAGIMTGTGQRISIQKAMMQAYYQPLGLPENCTIFDNNRKWTANISGVREVFPDAWVFAVVRPVAEVVDSFERLHTTNPLYASALTRGQANLTVYERVTKLLQSPEGVVGWSYNALRSAYYGPDSKHLQIIEYEDLARPLRCREVLGMIHDRIGKEPFAYDLNNVQQIPGVEEFDRKLAAPFMHTINPVVGLVPQPSVLPPDVLTHLHKTYPCFWRKR